MQLSSRDFDKSYIIKSQAKPITEMKKYWTN